MSRTSHNLKQTNWLITTTLLCLIVISFESCTTKPLLHEYISMKNEIWESTDTCNFQINIQNTDVEYDIHFYLRHTSSYPFSNCWFFIDRIAPDNSISSDTIEFDVADDYGRWKSSNVGSIMTLPISYQISYKFSQTGDYQYCIRQGMRTATLEGVQAVGFKLDYHGKK